MQILCRRLRLLVPILVLLVTALALAWPGLAQAPVDALAQLQGTTRFWSRLKGKITYESPPSMAYMWTSDAAYLASDLPEKITWTTDSTLDFGTDSPITWSGRQFSFQRTTKTHDPYNSQVVDAGYNETPCTSIISVQGAVSADGLAIESLAVSGNFACLNAENQVYAPSQSELTVRGPVPFSKMVKSSTVGSEYCAEYLASGKDVGQAVTQVSDMDHAFADRDYTVLGVAYDDTSWLRIQLCGPSPLTFGPELAPKGAVWELAGTDSSLGIDPQASKTCRQLDFAGPGAKTTPWGKSLAANTAICQVSLWQDCREGASAGSYTSVHNWTAPPNTLTPGTDLTLDLAVTVYGDAPDATTPKPFTRLLLDKDNLASTTGDGTQLGVTSPTLVRKTPIAPGSCTGSDPTCQDGGESRGRVRWTVPGGKIGDRLSLAFNPQGPACGGAYLYLYELHAFQKATAVPPSTAAPVVAPGPDAATGPGTSTEGGQGDTPGGGEDLLGLLPAGFETDGLLPGPESLAQALAGMFTPAVIIGMLAAFGKLGTPGGEPGSVDGGGRQPDGPLEMTLTDAEGRSFDYVWNPEYGGYINPETGGMLDQALWAEYNRNLAGNRQFIAEQRVAAARPTPRTPAQEFASVSQLAERMILGIPSRTGAPLQEDLEAIRTRVAGQGLSAADIEDLKSLTRTAWSGYRDRQESVHREAMDLEQSLGRWQTGLEVVAAAGKISGMVAEGMLGGNGFVTGFLYGAAENVDKGAGAMFGNGLIGGTFGWVGTRLGNYSPTGITWNAFTGALTGAGASAATDYMNTGKVDGNKAAVSAAVGAAGGALGAGMSKWLGGAEPELPPAGVPGVRRAQVEPVTGVMSKPKTVPLSKQPPAVRSMFENVEFGPDGRPYARLSDVLKVQRSSTDMRALKNAPPEVREAFNNTLRRDVYEPHDAQLVDWVKNNVPAAKGRPVKVDDFRTPGAVGKDPCAINTDRDYRMLMQNEKGEWIEIRKELWQGKSHEIFGQHTGFDPAAVKAGHPEIDWDRLTPEQQLTKQRGLWADDHQQMATDRASIEASPDYSDQGLVDGLPAQVEQNILKVKHGDGTLQDADAIGQMYYEKVAASLRRNNTPEAVAQAQKGVQSLWAVRRGYGQQQLPVGNMPSNLNQAMHLIQNAPTDHRATAEAMAGLNRQLAQLGFPAGVDDVSKAISAQFSALRFAGA